MAHDIEHDHMDNNHGEDGQAGYYHGTDYALPYMSPWSRIVDDEVSNDVLAHMNCSYLGSPDHPPTLHALKQHAQSLALLISYLEPSINGGRIDGRRLGDWDPRGVHDDGPRLLDKNGNPIESAANGTRTYIQTPQRRLEMGSAFDWLANLGAPYYNDDPDHWRPLNALMNEVKARNDADDTLFHCPLTDLPARPLGDTTKNEYYEAHVPKQSFSSHHNLVMHTNECLERLDHEYSPMGGILALVPPEGEGDNSAELAGVKNSLLGQLLMHLQGMYIRMHEMELELANMREALAKDAVVPMQSLTEGGPSARTGRELVVAQDRWVIVNHGEGEWKKMQEVLDQKANADEQVAETYRQGGAAGERDFDCQPQGVVYRAGVTAMDVTARVYRLRGSGHTTLFINPFFREPWTARLDARPGVLGLVAPRWPERVSAWQMRHDAALAAATTASRDAVKLRAERADRGAQVEALSHALDAQRRAAAAAADALAAVRAGNADAGVQQARTSEQWNTLTTNLGNALAAQGVAEQDGQRARARLEAANRQAYAASENAHRVQQLEEQLAVLYSFVGDESLSAEEVRRTLAESMEAGVLLSTQRQASQKAHTNGAMEVDDIYSADA